jgi:hypothetical protein
MALPAQAKVEAAPNFLANLAAAGEFFALQDPASAASRLSQLKGELRDMIAILAWSPGSGRQARFLAVNSAQARLRAEALLQLAGQAGLPDLREFVLGQHIVLYAHSAVEVVLLALKHQRQLIYGAQC